MYKRLITAILSVFVVGLYSFQVITLSGEITELSIVPIDQTVLNVSVSLGELEIQTIVMDRGEFSRLVLPGFHRSNEIGSPQLPEIHRLIELPQGSTPRVNIISETIKEVNLAELGIMNPVFPSQPSLSKSKNPVNVPFEWNETIYYQDKFIQQQIVEVVEKGQFRAARIGNLVIRPVEYNPSSGILRIHRNMEISISFDAADLPATQDLYEKYSSPYFESAYGQLANHEQFSSREDLVGDKISYLIISHPTFENQLQDFIDWKTEKGFIVIEGYLDEIGFSAVDIKSFIEDLYTNPTDDVPAPSFVLFVGDIAQVPAWDGNTGTHVTDLEYVNLTDDYIPEIYFGRFSATNEDELQPQIDKTIEYEKYEMPDPSFLGEVVMIGGMDASFGPIWANGQINYGTDHYFNIAHGIDSYTYLYPESGDNSVNIIDDVSNGVGYVNYTAHGSETSWADPSFTISDIEDLENEHEYPTVVGNCCLTNAFDTDECFGEAWLRAESKGAISYIGGTNNTYWDEDYWWGVGAGAVVSDPTYETTGPGAYDGMFHDNGEPESEWYITNYGIIVAGNLAVVEGGSLDDYYWEIYHNMGDPSVITYFGVPEENDVYYLPILPIGGEIFTIEAEPYSYVGLSMDGVLYASGTIGESGTLDLEVTPIDIAGTATVVVTSQNFQPYIGIVEIGNADGPYSVIDDYSIMTDDGNTIIEFNETVDLSLALKNVGNQIITDVSVQLTEDDLYISLIDATESFGNIEPDEVVIQNDAFSFYVGYNVPDNHHFTITTTISGSEETWDYNIDFVAFAPVLSNEGVEVLDADGQLDPGETADISVIVYNSGGASVDSAYAVFSTVDQYFIVNGDEQFDIGTIVSGATESATFNVTVSEDAPIGHVVSFVLDIHALGEYDVALNGSFTIGLVFEDFEDGLGTLAWEISGYSISWAGDDIIIGDELPNAGWDTTDEDSYSGNFCARPAEITHDQASFMGVTLEITEAGEIDFWYRIACEYSPSGLYFYDGMIFFINGNEVDRYQPQDDNPQWIHVSYPVGMGEQTFEWVYVKDGNDGATMLPEDASFVDMITFPPAHVSPPEPECTFGDVNADGLINVLDIVVIVNFIIEIDTPVGDELCAADVNEDETLNVLDIVQVINMIFNPDL